MYIHPAFTPDFYTNSYTAPSATSSADTNKSPLLFSPADGKTLDQFKSSEHFPKFKEQYLTLLDRLAQFAKDNAAKIDPPLSDAGITRLTSAVDQLKTRLFNGHYSTHEAKMYYEVKKLLHQLDDSLNRTDIPIEVRMDVAKELPHHLNVCAGGILTGLQDEITKLAYRGAGMKASASRFKIQLADNLILDHVRKTHKYHPGNEKHYVAAYRNRIAKDLNLPLRDDPMIRIGEKDIAKDQYEACRKSVLAKLKPSTLAKEMADEYMGTIKRDVFDARKIDTGLPFEGKDVATINKELESLQDKVLNKDYGPISTYDILRLNEEGTEGKLAGTTLVARSMMETLRAEGLVNFNNTVSFEGQLGTIKVLGDLFWLDNEGDCSELEAHDLLKVSPMDILDSLKKDGSIGANARAGILRNVAQYVLDAYHEKKIENVPTEWMMGFVEVFKQVKTDDKNWFSPAVLLATELGLTDVLQAMVDANADIFIHDEKGMSALEVAAEKGNVGMIEFLLRNGASPNYISPKGKPLLMHAIEHRQLDVVKLLIDEDADVHVVDLGLKTVLMAALEKGLFDLATKLIVEKEVDVGVKDSENRTALMYAAMSKEVPQWMIKKLLFKKPELRDAQDARGNRALAYAIESGAIEAAKALLSAGTDINFRHQRLADRTYLMLAAIKGNAEMARVLIENNAQVNDKDKDGRNALMVAAIADRADVARVLIEKEAELFETDKNNRNALMLAAERGCVNFMRVLIDEFKERERKEKEATEEKGRLGKIIDALLPDSSPLDILMINGMNTHTTALCLAAQNGKIAAASMLLDAGANIDVSGVGESPVMYAVRGGQLEMVKLLVKRNANLGADIFRGESPLSIAKRLGKHEIVEYLESAIKSRQMTANRRSEEWDRAFNPTW